MQFGNGVGAGFSVYQVAFYVYQYFNIRQREDVIEIGHDAAEIRREDETEIGHDAAEIQHEDDETEIGHDDDATEI